MLKTGDKLGLGGDIAQSLIYQQNQSYTHLFASLGETQCPRQAWALRA
jgi:hypothetical protein